jgi:prevent-host-death family protein
MTITAKELRQKTSQVLKKVQQLGSVTVTFRGRPVAKLTRLEKKTSRPLTNYPAYGMWAGRDDMADVEAWLRRVRKPRHLR